MAPKHGYIACPHCKNEDAIYDPNTLSDHISQQHPDLIDDDIEDIGLSCLEDKDGVESLTPTDISFPLPLGSDGVVTAPATADLTVAVPGGDVVVAHPAEAAAAHFQNITLGSNVGVVDVPADLTVAVPGGDVVVAHPDARAFALAMLEQVRPAMVSTYAVEDLTAVKTWLEKTFKATDVELMIEENFLNLSSVSLDLQLRVELLQPVPDDPGTIERDPAIVVSKALAEIQSSAAAAHFQNITLPLGSEGVVTAPATADVPADLTVAVPGGDVVVAHPAEAAAAHFQNITLGSNVGVVAVPGDLTVAVPGGDDVAQPDARALALAMLEQVLPTMVRTYAREDLTAVKSWVEEVLGIRDVELIMHDQFFLLSSVSLDLQVRMDLIDRVPLQFGSGDMAAVSGSVAVPGSNVALGLGTMPVPGSDLALSRADVVEADPSRADVVEPVPVRAVRADVVESDPGRADVEADVDAEMSMFLRDLQMSGGFM